MELSVGHTPLNNDVIDWVTIATSGDSTEATVNVDINDGETAYVKLRVTDKGNLIQIFCPCASNLFLICSKLMECYLKNCCEKKLSL